MIDSSTLYLHLLHELVTSPLGLFLIPVLLICAVGATLIPSLRWWLITAAIYASTLPIVGTEGRLTDFHLAFPLEQIRIYARPLTMFFLAMTMLPLLVFDRGWRLKLVIMPVWFFMLFQLGVSVRLLATEGYQRGVLTLASQGLLFVSLIVAVSSWLQSIRDAHRLLWALVVAMGGVLLGTCYQLAIDQTQVVKNSRLFGVSGNPQYLALMLAMTMPVVIYLLNNGAISKLKRVFLIGMIGLMVVMLMWTGSRMGALSTAVGIFAMYYRKMGRFVIVGCSVALIIFAITPFYEESVTTGERMFSTEDTRTAVWAAMWQEFLKEPVLGTAQGRIRPVENSYLSMLGMLGILGTIPFALAAIALIAVLIHLNRSRHRLGDQGPLVDCVTAIWAVMATIAMFEGILLGVFTFPILVLYLTGALTGYLVDVLRVQHDHSTVDATQGLYPSWIPDVR